MMRQNPEISERRAGARRAFTLTELSVSATIFVLMITMVMGMVAAQSKFSVSLGNYADMNESGRRAMTRFEQDMRSAQKVTAFSDTAVSTLLFPPDANVNSIITGTFTPVRVVYTYDAAQQKLFRDVGPAGATTRTVVLDNLIACKFLYFDKFDKTPAPTSADVKKILIAATMRRKFTGISNTDHLVAAVVTMRCRSNN